MSALKSTMLLRGLPHIVPPDRIEQMEEDKRKRLQNMVDNMHDTEVYTKGRQDAFLELFAITLSVQMSLDKLEISKSTYNKWRRTDGWFARCLNETIEEAHVELLGSAYIRAKGYTKLNEDGTDIERDAGGRPIWFGASDTLAKMFLSPALPSAKQDGSDSAPVIEINIANLVGQEGATEISRGIAEGHGHINLIDENGDVVEEVPSE